MKEILYLTQSRDTLPSVRFRVLPFIERARARGLNVQRRRIPKSIVKRLLFFVGLPKVDVVIVQKKLFAEWELKLLRKKCGKLVFDFDDALWACHPCEETNPKRKRREAKIRKRFAQGLPHFDCVVAGNSYLARHALDLNSEVRIVPTPLDTSIYEPGGKTYDAQPPVVGWMGTSSNLFFLPDVLGMLQPYTGELKFSVVADKRYDYQQESDDASFEYWHPEKEVEQLRAMDIGLMPLTDDEYTRGKCGFKILQYMACGAVPIASEVGFNSEIIDHGIDGFLVREPEDWPRFVMMLAKDPDMRARMAANAREKVTTKFDLKAVADDFWDKLGL